MTLDENRSLRNRLIGWNKLMGLKCLISGHDPEVIGKPYPYPHGIDNPFMKTDIGWGRAWEIPVRCKRCGCEYTWHRSSPSLLQRHISFYWSATESNISLATEITNKLNAMSREQLEELWSYVDKILLTCSVCGFTTTNPKEYRKHIFDEHLEVLQQDVMERGG